MADGSDYLTTRQAAALAHVTPDAIRRRFKQPDAPEHSRTPGGHLRIPRQPFEAWLQQRRRRRA